MKALLDTHALLWAFSGDPRLSEPARSALLNENVELYFSIAGLWEIAIKVSLGKLRLQVGWFELVKREMAINAVQWLAVQPAHCLEVERLPFHHRDPFDRMLAAQALVEHMGLISRDPQMDAYGVPRIW